jgi:hypothetical protein
MPITVNTGQDWRRTRSQLQRMKDGEIFTSLEKYGQMGVAALSAATPVDGGETAAAWSFEIVRRAGYFSIRWKNNHTEGGAPIAILLQYGHGTGTGGYVQGRDYINPAMQPIFDQIDAEVRKVVSG